MTLPFPLGKDHKKNMKATWKYRGMIFVDDYHFWYVYNEYIHATNCDLCNVKFPNSQNRHLDHCYNTGDPRNVVCNSCNHNRKDNKKIATNTGEANITKRKEKGAKTGYSFQIRISRDETCSLNTKRNTLEKAIICRDEFIAAHPDIYT
tara:strand:+ start:141 stop:587 length:447 start_codon:yes stop_codon:yes gene_type:complete